MNSIAEFWGPNDVDGHLPPASTLLDPESRTSSSLHDSVGPIWRIFEE